MEAERQDLPDGTFVHRISQFEGNSSGHRADLLLHKNQSSQKSNKRPLRVNRHVYAAYIGVARYCYTTRKHLEEDRVDVWVTT